MALQGLFQIFDSPILAQRNYAIYPKLWNECCLRDKI